MRNLFTFLLPLFLFNAEVECRSPSSLSTNQKDTRLGQGQAESDLIRDSVAGGRYRSHRREEYDSSFRPPCPTSEQCPTLVKISLSDVKIKSFNDTRDGETLRIEAVMGMEYKDSRIAFEMPEGYTKNYVKNSESSPMMGISIWYPRLQIQGDQKSLSGRHYDEYDSTTLFNSEGEIYSRKGIVVDAKFIEYKETALIFSMRIGSRWDFVDDIVLEWGSEMEELSFRKRVKSTSGKGEYRVQVGEVVGPCQEKQIQKYGPMGEHELSCIELQLKLIPESSNSKNNEITD